MTAATVTAGTTDTAELREVHTPSIERVFIEVSRLAGSSNVDA
jgi:hypothetical protein